MNHELQQRVLHTIRRRGMITAGNRLGVAVSAGADSVALLLLLQGLNAQLSVVLSVVHVNHQLRGADSDQDEEFVRALAEREGLELHCFRVDVAAEARRNRWNLEDAGRRLRRRFYDGLIEQGKVDRVAVAHTADDQAETVLAHLLRGTGLTGLAGIHPVTAPVVRPLLAVRRQELREFLVQRGQDWREDATNQDTNRLRARIRHSLIPLLEKEYQPALVERLQQLAELARAEDEFWEDLVDSRTRQVVNRQLSGLTVPAAELCGPPAMARRLVRRLARDIAGGFSAPRAAQVERVLELARLGQGGQKVELSAGLSVQRTLDNRLHFQPADGETNWSALSYQYDVAWPLQESTTVKVCEVGSRFRLKLIDWPRPSRETRVGCVPLDAGLLTPPLVLRNWRPGDAYRPAGRHRVHKLKDLLYRAKVEACERESWPVLTSAGQVVWARDLPPAAECAATVRTQTGLVIEEERV